MDTVNRPYLLAPGTPGPASAGIQRGVLAFTFMLISLPPLARALEPIEPDIGPLLLQARQHWEQGDQLGHEASRVARTEGDPIPLLDQQIAAYEAAEMKYLQALKRSPTHPHALFDYGRLLISQRRYRAGRNRLEAALASPRMEKAFLPAERADLMRTLGGVLERAGGWTRAIELYRKSFKANPEDPRNRLSLAVALCAWDDPVEAIELLRPWQESTQALRTVTPSIRSLGIYTLGYALEEDGRPEEAEKAYRQARALAQEAGTSETAGVGEQAGLALQRLAPVLEKLKQEGVKEALARAAQLCREGWRRRQDALRDWLAFAEARQKLWAARTAQEKDEIRQQEPLRVFYEAVRCFDNATQVYPGYARAYRQQGLCYLALVERSAALPQLEAAALYDPHSPSGLAALGETQLSNGDPADALRTFERLLRSEPEYGPGHLGLARALFGQLRTERDLDQALRALDRAKSLGADLRTIMHLEKEATKLQERLRRGERLTAKPATGRPRTAPEGDDLWKGSVLD